MPMERRGLWSFTSFTPTLDAWQVAERGFCVLAVFMRDDR